MTTNSNSNTTTPTTDGIFDYNCAFVRELSPNFANALSSTNAKLDVHLAEKQHTQYINLLRKLLPQVIVVPGDASLPDCGFVEDTCVALKGLAVLAQLGAQTRQGEEVAVRQAMEKLNAEHSNKAAFQLRSVTGDARFEGGDCMFDGRSLFVGLTKRTNEAGAAQLENILKSVNVPVIRIRVAAGLHFKSAISQISERTFVIVDTSIGHALRDQIQALDEYKDIEFLSVPDGPSCNVSRIGQHLVIQAGFPKSESILRSFAEKNGLHVHTLEMSETIKADGALTCGSVLVKI